MRQRALALVLLLALVEGCVSTVQHKPIDDAKITYVNLSIGYDAGIKALTELRAAHKLTDAQWQQVEHAAAYVREVQPVLRSAIDTWASTGERPLAYDAEVKLVADAVTALLQIHHDITGGSK